MSHIEEEAAKLLARFLRNIEKISLKKFTYKLSQKGKKRKKLQNILFGVITNIYLIDWLLNNLDVSQSECDINLLRVIAYRLAIEQNMEILNRINKVCGYDLFELKNKFDQLLMIINKMNPIDKLSLKYSFPRWIIRNLMRWFTLDELEQLLVGLNQRTPAWVIVNTLKADVDEVKNLLEEEGYKVSRDSDFCDVLKVDHLPKPLEKSNAYKKGLIVIADKSSISAVYALDPKPGDVILDMCSAPGIKLICSAFHMGEGKIIAIDISETRIKRMKYLLKMYEIEKYVDVKIHVKDSRHLTLDDANGCNKILLDPECTSSGIIPRTPDVKLRLTPEVLKEKSQLQRELLLKALEIGIKLDVDHIVYSVCSIFAEEAELLIDEILRKFDVKISELPFGIDAYIPKTGKRFFPHIHKTLGFFVSKIIL